MKKMTSRERVRAAARREPVDRVPVMLWLEGHTAVKVATQVVRPRRAWERVAFNALRTLSETLPTEELRNATPLAAYLLNPEFHLELGADLVDFYWGFYPLWLKGVGYRDGRFFYTDMYGIERGMGGLYMETVGPPLKSAQDIERYRFPDMSHPIHYEHIRLFRKLHPDAAIGVWCPGVQDWSQGWFGMENLYKFVIDIPEAIESFFRKLADHSMQIIRGAMRAGADTVIIGDDYGTQLSMFMSKAMWTRFVFPQLKRQCGEIHRRGGLAFLHSCGYVAPLLDKFVEAGVDILHPFQPLPGNNLEAAVAEFGDKLCFCTGIDVQKMPTYTPEEVRRSILDTARIATSGRDGGFILAHTNGLQEDASVENLKAMFDAVRDVQKGNF